MNLQQSPSTTRGWKFRTAATRLFLAAIAVVLASLLPGSAPEMFAQEAAPTLEFLQETQVIPLDGSVQVQLVLRNHTESVLNQIQLTSITDAAASVEFSEPASLGSLAAGGEQLWTMKLTHLPEGSASGTLYVFMHYSIAAEAGDEQIPRVLVAQLALTNPAEEQVDEMASVEIKSATLSINEKHAGQLYVIVTNTSATGITVHPIVSSGPDFVDINEETIGESGLVIEPGAAHAIPIEVTASDAVQPGTYLLLFEVPISWTRSGTTHSDNIIASQEVEITVFGESDILTALAVPSFLLLPGMLALFTAKLVWFWGRKKPENGAFPLTVLSQEFWVIAISLSLIAALTYPHFTRELIGNRRDYLDGYGLMDIVRVWFGAVVLSVIAVFSFNTVRRLISAIRASRRARAARAYYVNAGDGELKTLRKLGQQGKPVILPQVRITPAGGGTSERVFVLGSPDESDQDHLIVGPSLTYRWLRTDGETGDLISKVNATLAQPDATMKELAEFVQRGVELKSLELKWDKSGTSILQPTSVPKAQTVEAGTFRFVEPV